MLYVIIRIVANPLLNLYQKKLTNHEIPPLVVVTFSYMFAAIVGLTWLLFRPYSVNTTFVHAILLAGVLDGVGNLLLVHSLKTTELSLFGPVNSYKAIVALIFAAVTIHEVPTLSGWLGVFIIFVGSYIMNISKNNFGLHNFTKMFKDRGVLYRLLSLFVLAYAAIYLKVAVDASNYVITFTWWAVTGAITLLIFMPFMLHASRDSIATAKQHLQGFVVVGILFVIMQLATLITFRQIFVGYALALFQLSAVISVILGRRILKEGRFVQKLVGSAVMVIGALLIGKT